MNTIVSECECECECECVIYQEGRQAVDKEFGRTLSS